jgi:hypothetical protein
MEYISHDSSRILSLRRAAQRSSVRCSNASAVQDANSPTAVRSRSPMPQGATLTSIQFRRGDLNIDAQSQCSLLSGSRQISIPGLQPRCLRPSRLVLCDASHVETRVLPFSCILQFAPDSASFVLSFALDVPPRNIPFPSSPTYLLSSPCRRNRLLTESLQLAPPKVCTRLFSITLNGSMARTEHLCPQSLWLEFRPLVFPAVGVRLGLYVPVVSSFF